MTTIKQKTFTPTDKAVTPKVTVVTPAKMIEDDYFGSIPPPPVLPEATLLEMEVGRATLKRHAESLAAALANRQAAPAEPAEELVKRDPTHVPGFNWTPAQQRARSV